MQIPDIETLEIPLGGQPEETAGRLFRGPSSLTANTNGSHEKHGYLTKARGYRRADLTTTVLGFTPETLFVCVGLDAGELVLVGRDFTYSVGAPGTDIDEAQLIRRGPSPIGNYRTGTVHVSALAEE
jgi:hypothetical protein